MDVFISYAREDRAHAEHIAHGLSALGLEPFWDTDIPPGQTWADYIEAKLAACKAAIVLWSAHSVKSQWVREEARIARDRSQLIPVLLEQVQPPFGFGEVQAADLTGWTGDYNDPRWVRFSQAVQNVAARAPNPRAAPLHSTTPTPQPAAQAYSAGAAHNESASSPIGYIQNCLRLYADGRGRARRAEYGWFILFYVAVLLTLATIDAMLFGFTYEGTPNYVVTWLVLGLLPAAVSAASRRLHDLNLSGWLAIVTVIPYLGWLAILALIFAPSKDAANAYGPNPKASAAV